MQQKTTNFSHIPPSPKIIQKEVEEKFQKKIVEKQRLPKLQEKILIPEITKKLQQRQSFCLRNHPKKDYKTFFHNLNFKEGRVSETPLIN